MIVGDEAVQKPDVEQGFLDSGAKKVANRSRRAAEEDGSPKGEEYGFTR
jgi:hypothetical protein